ncbi:MAG: TRAP transporter permease [Firmicutes bacterium]|nr:TRAP transporter permease [Bacillota bacterium]
MIFGKNNQKKIDNTAKRRKLEGWEAKSIIIIGIIWTSFHLVIASGILLMSPVKIRAIHLSFALVMCFFLAPFSRKAPLNKVQIIDYLLMVISVTTMVYTVFRYDTLVRMGGRYKQIDIIVGIIAIIVLFEAARRVVSPGLVGLAATAIIFAYFGKYLPEPFTHSGFSINRLVQHLYLTGEGIFGFILGVSAEIIIVFIIFGSVLQEVGVADFFYDLSNSIAGRSKGGPAKVAVVSSCLMGMVSGETSANVATTGSFTIPLMKRVGYSPEFSGAVECAASAGGQIMPPVMGATAFIIADSLGIPYIRLALAAFIPAILYFTGVFSTVHFRAVRLGLTGLKKEELPNFKEVLLKKGYLILPLLGIVYLLLKQYTPTFSAFWGGIVLAIAITSIKKETRLNVEKIARILTRASKTAMSLAIACALVGIIVGVASLTGITLTIADAIFKISGGEMFPALVMTMLVSLVLGMGLPTTAAYVLTSISAAPVLIRLGIDMIPAHLFVLYFGVMSALTPPVATGAYTAAGLAGANPNKLGFTSLKIALSGFIAPFLFVYNQNLILHQGMALTAVIEPFITSFIGIVGLSAALEGAWNTKFSTITRIAMGIGSILLVKPGRFTNVAGAVILGMVLFYHYYVEDRRNTSLGVENN